MCTFHITLTTFVDYYYDELSMLLNRCIIIITKDFKMKTFPFTLLSVLFFSLRCGAETIGLFFVLLKSNAEIKITHQRFLCHISNQRQFISEENSSKSSLYCIA